MGRAKSGKNVDLKIPETALPPIPLGTVPGKLQLTVSSKSEIHAAFSASCVSVKGGAGSWNGELVPSGTLVLEGAIKLEVPGFDKTIELGEISIPVALGGKPRDARVHRTHRHLRPHRRRLR